MCDNSDFNSDYKDNLVSETDSANRQELKKSTILLKTRT